MYRLCTDFVHSKTGCVHTLHKQFSSFSQNFADNVHPQKQAKYRQCTGYVQGKSSKTVQYIVFALLQTVHTQCTWYVHGLCSEFLPVLDLFLPFSLCTGSVFWGFAMRTLCIHSVHSVSRGTPVPQLPKSVLYHLVIQRVL